MPTLTLDVTAGQADRIAAALQAKYAGTPLEGATLAVQATKYIKDELTQFVRQYEERLRVKEAVDKIAPL